MKTKIVSYNGNINRDFHDSGMPKDGSCSISNIQTKTF